MAHTIAACRNASTSKKPSIHKNVLETLQRENSGSLATYDFGETFHRKFDVSNTFGKYYLGKGPDPDSQPRLFSANIVAEVGSEAEGTWLSACNKKLPASELLMRSVGRTLRTRRRERMWNAVSTANFLGLTASSDKFLKPTIQLKNLLLLLASETSNPLQHPPHLT
ncbi:hypothetical protein B0H14DRAFT_2632740 [Mycena olivaceomarginata]|nr:hypothetical protein B0H14DRAFT_2632740 [Mycena olivaceomarginata]